MVKQLYPIVLMFIIALFTIGAGRDDLMAVKQEADPLVENILKSMNEGNYEGYIKDFNASMKGRFHTEEIFMENNKKLREKYGKYIAKEFLRIGKLNQHYILYYKITFSKSDHPVIFRVVLERVDKRLKIAFLSFPAIHKKTIRGHNQSAH